MIQNSKNHKNRILSGFQYLKNCGEKTSFISQILLIIYQP